MAAVLPMTWADSSEQLVCPPEAGWNARWLWRIGWVLERSIYYKKEARAAPGFEMKNEFVYDVTLCSAFVVSSGSTFAILQHWNQIKLGMGFLLNNIINN
jgi:hypothetical protein